MEHIKSHDTRPYLTSTDFDVVQKILYFLDYESLDKSFLDGIVFALAFCVV